MVAVQRRLEQPPFMRPFSQRPAWWGPVAADSRPADTTLVTLRLFRGTDDQRNVRGQTPGRMCVLGLA